MLGVYQLFGQLELSRYGRLESCVPPFRQGADSQRNYLFAYTVENPTNWMIPNRIPPAGSAIGT